MQAPTAAGLRLLDWDSAHFGLRIGRITVPRLDPELSREALAWADSSALDCMYLLVDAGDAASIRQAGETGWRMVDIRVTLGARVMPHNDVGHQNDQPSGRVREARSDDLPYLKDLARRSHRDSRFYADGSFPEKASDELFAIWIERSVEDRSFAGTVFVAELEDGQPAGYITCALKDGVGEIGLIAVDERARRRGVGSRLLAEAARWFTERQARHISVVTQGNNLGALRMYQRCGFSIDTVQVWFHWWRARA